MNFSQSNSRLSSATFSSPNTNSITITTWFKTSSSTLPQIIADGGGDLNFRLGTSNAGKIHQAVGNGTTWYPGAWLDSVTTLVANKWYHYAYVYDNTNHLLKVYLNGVLENSVSVNITRSSTAGIHIGNYSGYDNSAFKGTIDDFRVYSRALSDTEIAKLAGAGISNSTKYDASSTAYFANAGITSLTGKAQIDEFIKGLKSMGIWNNISEIWLMRNYQNASSTTNMYGLKNTYNGTYTGTVTRTRDGLLMADGNAGVNYSPNATITFSAGGPSAIDIWSGMGNASVAGDYYNFLMSSGSQLRYSLTSNVGGGTTWQEMFRDVKGSRWYRSDGSNINSMTSNHMAGWNADTMHLMREGIPANVAQSVTTTQTDGSYTLQSRGRTAAGAGTIRQSMLLMMPPGINLTDAQMTKIYNLYKDTAGYGLNLP